MLIPCFRTFREMFSHTYISYFINYKWFLCFKFQYSFGVPFTFLILVGGIGGR